MTNSSKLTYTQQKKYFVRSQLIIFFLLTLLSISFFIDLSIRTFNNGTKTLQDLTHVSGAIKNERIIKHFNKGSRFRQPYYEDVLVFSIEGSDDEFGFLNSHNNYNDLIKVRYGGGNTIADIYYDKSGKRIEQNITLHTFELKIDDVRFVKIEDIQKSEKTGFIVCLLASVILLLITFLVIKSIIKKKYFSTAFTK